MTETKIVPDLSGRTVRQARATLGALGLNLVVNGRPPGPADDNASISRNDPATTTDRLGPGSSISIGGTVGVILF